MFDDHRLAVHNAASAARDVAALEAHLLPDGHIALPGADPDPAATWQILGCTPREGCVVRAELARACWVTRIELTWLARQDREARDPRAPERPASGATPRLDHLLLTASRALSRSDRR